MRLLIHLGFACVALAISSTVLAHKPSDSYLAIRVEPGNPVANVQWDIALRDLEVVLALDSNHDGSITWGEVRSRKQELERYALSHLTLLGDGTPCTFAPAELLVDNHSDGAYAVLRFDARCSNAPARLEVGYSLLFDIDPTHRGLLRLDVGGNSTSAVLSPEHADQAFELRGTSRMGTFVQFLEDGMHHIWIGYDHMLFLISLLLPSVLRRNDERWVPVRSLREALLSVLAVVTAFTLSHSITLTLSALGVIGLPSRLVESGIALSVLLAALNNIWPLVSKRVWLLAFGFGLVHGFGFASVLADLGLPQGALALALAGFNIGVEIGQLGVVAVVVPLIFLVRTQRFYRPAVLTTGSGLIASVASVWLVSRVLGWNLG